MNYSKQIDFRKTQSSRLIWTAASIAALAIIVSFVVGWFAYTASRQIVLDSVAHESLSIGRSIVNQVDAVSDPVDKTPDAKQRALNHLAAVWDRTEPPYPGSYLCVIERPGILALHTKQPKMQGTNVAKVIVDPKSKKPRTVAQLLESRESLAAQNVNFRGMDQLVGYCYMPSIDAFVVVHVPASLVENNIRKTTAPWTIGLALIAGLLIPLSVGLIHSGYLSARRNELEATAALSKSERKLRDQFAELELLYQSAPIGLCFVDRDLRFVRINDKLAEINGRSPDEHIGMPLDEVLPEIIEFIEPIYRQVIETGQPALDFEVERPDPREPDELRYYSVSYYPLTNDDDEVTGISSVVQDITERKRITSRLHEREERFRTLCAHASVGIFLDDADGNCTYINDCYGEIAGLTNEQAMGQGWTKAIHPDDRARVVDSWQNSSLVSTNGSAEYRFLRWDGSIRWVVGNCTPHFDDAGKLIGFIGTIFDVTQMKRAEKELQEHRQTLAHVSRLNTMGEMVAGIAHEVKQPLCAISNFAAASSNTLRKIEQDRDLNAASFGELAEWINEIKDASQRAAEIVRHLRDFSRKGERERQEIDINQIVRDSIKLLAFETRECGVIVETELADDLPTFLAKRIQCEQVVVNLLQNAVEALAQMESPRRVIVSTVASGTYAEIQVADNGHGVQSDQNGNLFEAFNTTKGNGMGMGLAISRSIVEEHNGRIWVSRNELGGATFHFTLLVADEAESLTDGLRHNSNEAYCE